MDGKKAWLVVGSGGMGGAQRPEVRSGDADLGREIVSTLNELGIVRYEPERHDYAVVVYDEIGAHSEPTADLVVELIALDDGTFLAPIIEYTSAPQDGWYPCSVAELEQELAEIRDRAETARTGWSRSAIDADIAAFERAIELARSGRDAYVANDDDGPYAAVAVGSL